MKLYFEDYKYRIESLRENLSDRFYVYNKKRTHGYITHVGYYYNYNAAKPEKSDSVFILPKLFIESGRPFGLQDFTPEQIINLNEIKEIDKGVKDLIFSLSTWLYRAISRYYTTHQDTKIYKEQTYIQDVISSKGDSSSTYLDIILQLIKFHKDKHNLFTYISIVNSSGHNNIDWNKTISRTKPILNKNRLIYTNFMNRSKMINYDEELIILFYSVLQYLKRYYNFNISSEMRYKLIPTRRIRSMIETSKGTKRLREIRNKYFTDDLVSLWNLVYTFFEKSEKVCNRRYHEEILVASSFDRVFEDMIDKLLGDNESELPPNLKVSEDGKQRLDHIYLDKAILDTYPEMIYYIGDSKYYKSADDIGVHSIPKQFGYAKHVIQYFVNLLLEGSEEFKYRDELTEGYNISPNFFILGKVDNANHEYSYSSLNLQETGEVKINKHFSDRLFDRDTLIVQSYNINFLYALYMYATNSSSLCRDTIRKTFRKDLVKTFNKHYNFFKAYPKGADIEQSITSFVDKHFRKFVGKMFRPSKTAPYILFAFEHNQNLITQEERNTEIQNLFEASLSNVIADCNSFEVYELE